MCCHLFQTLSTQSYLYIWAAVATCGVAYYYALVNSICIEYSLSELQGAP